MAGWRTNRRTARQPAPGSGRAFQPRLEHQDVPDALRLATVLIARFQERKPDPANHRTSRQAATGPSTCRHSTLRRSPPPTQRLMQRTANRLPLSQLSGPDLRHITKVGGLPWGAQTPDAAPRPARSTRGRRRETPPAPSPQSPVRRAAGGPHPCADASRPAA